MRSLIIFFFFKNFLRILAFQRCFPWEILVVPKRTEFFVRLVNFYSATGVEHCCGGGGLLCPLSWRSLFRLKFLQLSLGSFFLLFSFQHLVHSDLLSGYGLSTLDILDTGCSREEFLCYLMDGTWFVRDFCLLGSVLFVFFPGHVSHS